MCIKNLSSTRRDVFFGGKLKTCNLPRGAISSRGILFIRVNVAYLPLQLTWHILLEDKTISTLIVFRFLLIKNTSTKKSLVFVIHV